jgi:hypothetical protein
MTRENQILQLLKLSVEKLSLQEEVLRLAEIKNPWFTQKNIQVALDGWLHSLNDSSSAQWLSHYNFDEISQNSDKKLGVIAAGNIPLVGLHDVLCGVLCGYTVWLKPSSDDETLMKWLITDWITLLQQNGIWNSVEFVEQLKGIDAAIATGNNNSARYFEYYFRHIPHLLRNNRNSVAVLGPQDQLNEKDYINLGLDVFQHFGLGCRNVTKVFLPRGFEYKPLFDVWEQHFADTLFHNKYANNYNYHKALLLMNLDPHIDAGYILMNERTQIHSPVGILNYSYYDDIGEVSQEILQNQDLIQCVVSNLSNIPSIAHILPFGTAQCPLLSDYADGVDTVAFLLGHGDR